MNIFDIIGPVMVGPSSSHTAGAVKIGYAACRLMGEPIQKAKILLYGSFLLTGRGHGTDRALIAGLLGMKPDDARIPDSYSYAKEAQMEVVFGESALKEAHPNTAQLELTGISGKQLTLTACSLGGGRIAIRQLDGLDVNFHGDYPTLIVHNMDRPGLVTEVTALLASQSINIASMQLYRDNRGGNAIMVLECDQEIPEEFVAYLQIKPDIKRAVSLNLQA